MFTRMQRYHKAFLIAVTVIISASFGMGTIILAFVGKGNMTKVGTVAGEKISSADFDNARAEWNRIYRVARILSAKAKRIGQAESIYPQINNPMFDQYPMYKEMMLDRSLAGYTTKQPGWDDIFSLKEEVVKLDRQYYELIFSTNPQRVIASIAAKNKILEARRDKSLQRNNNKLLLENKLNLLEEEVRLYYYLPGIQRKSLIDGDLSDKDIWTYIMLLKKAENAGVQVTQTEVDSLLLDAKKIMGERYQSLFRDNFKEKDLARSAHKALVILKYVQSGRAGIHIPMNMAYKTYIESHKKQNLQWARFSHDLDQIDEEQYKEMRLTFYDAREKDNPEYFQLPARADFEYIYAKASKFEDKVEIDDKKIDELYQKQKSETKSEEIAETFDEDLDEDELSEEELEKKREKAKKEKEKKAKKEIRKKLVAEKAEAKAHEALEEIYRRILSTAKEAPLSELASQFDMRHKEYQDVSEEEFFDMVSEGNDQLKDQLYSKLEAGSLTAVLKVDKGYLMARLNKRVAPRKLSREEIATDEGLFLERYYTKSINAAKDFVEYYRIGYVLLDAKALKQNLLATTSIKKELFYEKYKEQLYALDGEKKYKKFEDVQDDIDGRIANFIAVQEMQNFFWIYEKCKNPSKKLAPEFLFFADLSYRQELEKGKVPAGLQELFKANKHELSPGALAKANEQENDSWFIGDIVKKQAYLVRLEQDRLAIYSDAAQNADLAKIVNRIKIFAMVPESLRYIESSLLTKEEILRDNPTGDPEFNPENTQVDKISPLQDTQHGKYFYKVLEKDTVAPDASFAQVRERVKKLFLEREALEKARKKAQNFRSQYQKLWQANSKKQKMSQEKAFELFRALTYQYDTTCRKTSYIESLSEVPELKNVQDWGQALQTIEPTKLSDVLMEKKRGSALLLQIIDRKVPGQKDIPEARLKFIRRMLWERQFSIKKTALINYKQLKQMTGMMVTK